MDDPGRRETQRRKDERCKTTLEVRVHTKRSAIPAEPPVHTDSSLHELEEALLRFHDHKDIFIELGARNDFEINKLHYAIHYRYMIQ